MYRSILAWSLVFCLVVPAAQAIPGPYVVTGPHSKRVHRALGLLRNSLDSPAGAACRDYFDRHGWRGTEDPSNGLPLVVITDVDLPGSSQRHALVPGRSPWTVIYLNPSILAEGVHSRLEDCDLASILLHEMGHLARKDTADNEPKDFFRSCRIRCLDPGAWK